MVEWRIIAYRWKMWGWPGLRGRWQRAVNGRPGWLRWRVRIWIIDWTRTELILHKAEMKQMERWKQHHLLGEPFLYVSSLCDDVTMRRFGVFLRKAATGMRDREQFWDTLTVVLSSQYSLKQISSSSGGVRRPSRQLAQRQLVLQLWTTNFVDQQ